MKKSKIESAGFTLIELMIVFVIIIVLAAMVLRLMGLAGNKNAEAMTRERLERVAQALEEFRATYGRYPPVDYYPVEIEGIAGGFQPLEYEYSIAGKVSMPEAVKTDILGMSKTKNIWGAGGEGRVFTFGLMSYFFPRYNSHAMRAHGEFVGRDSSDDGKPDKDDHHFTAARSFNQWDNYNDREHGDPLADCVQNVESSRRILPFLGASLNADGTVASYGIVRQGEVGRFVRKLPSNDSTDPNYINISLSIFDGWERTINYRSRPPYDSYRLWSNGPDGATGKRFNNAGKEIADYSDDDIVVGEG